MSLDYSPSTLLSSGKVLLAGGEQPLYRGIKTTGQCALYDGSSGSWVITGSMTAPRSDHTTTLLPNGQVLAVGGTVINGVRSGFLASAELYTP
jgi:hypothetical protein